MRDNAENTEIYREVLNFDEEKRAEWEKKRLPYAAQIEITPKCNLNCVHCYLQKCHNLQEMSLKQITDILDILYEEGILFLTLTGGEIFTRIDFADIYMYAKKKGFLIELFTNGVLLDEEIINTLNEYPPLLVDISLYGACEETYKTVTGVSGAFDKVIHNCRRLTEKNIRVSLKSPILQLTQNEIEDMKGLAEQLGITFAPSFEIIPATDSDMITRKYQLPSETCLRMELEESEKKKSHSVEYEGRYKVIPEYIFQCKIGRNSFVIDYEGRMCPCMKMRHRGKKLTGNNFQEIWKSFEQYTTRKASEHYKCLKCKAREYCEICPAEMDMLYGDFEERKEEDCIYYKARELFYRKNRTADEAVRWYCREKVNYKE